MDGRDRLLGFLDQEMGDRFTSELERLGLWLRLGDAPVKCEIDARRAWLGDHRERRGGDGGLGAGRGGRSGIPAGWPRGAGHRARQAREHRRQRALPDRGAAHLRGRRRGGFPGSPQPAWSRAGWPCARLPAAYKTRVNPLFPYGIYTIPEISYVGANEEELKRRASSTSPAVR